MLKLSNLINEEDEKYEYGCVMLYTDFPSQIIKLQDTIDPNDVQSPGIEHEPHCTLLYGLHAGVTIDQVESIVHDFKFSDLKAFNPSLFENPEFDVFKYDIGYPTRGGSFLHQCNERLKKLPHTSSYPDYHPHMTIAYLQPGKGKKYVEYFKKYGAEEFMASPKYIIFSKPDGSKVKIEF